MVTTQHLISQKIVVQESPSSGDMYNVKLAGEIEGAGGLTPKLLKIADVTETNPLIHKRNCDKHGNPHPLINFFMAR